MDELSFNGNGITKESFPDIATEKINQILCFPGNDQLRKWAVKFLQKATRGFAPCDHEPWLNSLSTVESTRVILSKCKSSVRKFDLATPSAKSSLSFVINYPLQFNPFISALASLFISEIDESKQRCCVSNEKLVKRCSTFHSKTDGRISSTVCSNNENTCESNTQNKHARDLSDFSPTKKRRTDYETQPLNTDEITSFLKHVWEWARSDCIKLDPHLLGDVISHLPECIEEVVLSWAKEALRNNQRDNLVDHGVGPSIATAGFRRDVPSDDDVIHSLSVLQESPIFLAAAASSHKLFQSSSSILNQLLIQASECSCSWPTMLSLCKTFAQETAKGRAEFYPLQVQPLVLLMEVDPNSLSSDEQRSIISNQLTSMFLSLPTEITVSVFSHFPAWLPFLDYAILL